MDCSSSLHWACIEPRSPIYVVWMSPKGDHMSWSICASTEINVLCKAKKSSPNRPCFNPSCLLWYKTRDNVSVRFTYKILAGLRAGRCLAACHSQQDACLSYYTCKTWLNAQTFSNLFSDTVIYINTCSMYRCMHHSIPAYIKQTELYLSQHEISTHVSDITSFILQPRIAFYQIQNVD